MNGRRATRVIGTAAFALLSIVVVMALFVIREDQVQRDYGRLLFIHPAVAWVAYVAFGITSLSSLLWLWPKTRAPRFDHIAAASTEVGLVFIALTLATGSIWGRPTWGVWWTWDARLTTTALLFFLYLGVAALRRLPADPEVRAKRSAIAALVAFVDVPIVHQSVEWWRTLHQEPSVLKRDLFEPEVHGRMLYTMLLSFVAFTLVYVWMVIVRARLERWQGRLDAVGLDAAIVARRAEGRADLASGSGQGRVLPAGGTP